MSARIRVSREYEGCLPCRDARIGPDVSAELDQAAPRRQYTTAAVKTRGVRFAVCRLKRDEHPGRGRDSSLGSTAYRWSGWRRFAYVHRPSVDYSRYRFSPSERPHAGDRQAVAKFYETSGDDVANELVEWFNAVDATYRSDLRELNEINFARFDAKLGQRMHELEARLIKWMFIFVTGSTFTVLGVMAALLKL